jgi:hypothetical protein
MPEDLSQKHMESKVSDIRFEPAVGGLISHTERLEKGNKGDPYGMHKRESAVHTSMSSAVGHLRKTLGHQFKARLDEAVGMHKEAGRKHESAGMKKKERSMKKG